MCLFRLSRRCLEAFLHLVVRWSPVLLEVEVEECLLKVLAPVVISDSSQEASISAVEVMPCVLVVVLVAEEGERVLSKQDWDLGVAIVLGN